ncbi:PD-(D/E)XK nuclease family protein [bacterium]|nr:PD-(D/E)XK nuclease family protein [bacterium]
MKIPYSGLETYENCPKKFEFRYQKKIKAPKTKEQIFGTLIHSILKEFHSSLVKPKLNQLLQIYKEKWPQEKGIWQNQEEEKNFFEEGLKILSNYYQKNYQKDFTIVDLESKFNLPIKESSHPASEEHIITGQIDRIDKIKDNFFEIIDYKTSQRMPSQQSIDNNFQLGVYALGFLEKWPSLKNSRLKLSLYFLKHQEKMSVFLTEELIEATKERIIKIINQIKKEYFPPYPGPLCSYCPYQTICPIWKNLYEEETPSDKEIKKLTEEFLEIKKREQEDKKRLIEIRKQIENYLEKKGIERIYTEKGYLSRSSQRRKDFDFEKIKEILEPLGLWQEILKVDRNKFSQLLEKLPKEILEKIEKEASLPEKEFKSISVSFKKIKPPSQL